jgi:hypothetical protein
MIVSKEPIHSLGGYSHRKTWSHTRWKGKKINFYAGYGVTRKSRSNYFLVYTRFFFTIASGATPIGSAGRAPDEITDYKSYEAGVEVHCQTRLLHIETVKQG